MAASNARRFCRAAGVWRNQWQIDERRETRLYVKRAIEPWRYVPIAVGQKFSRVFGTGVPGSCVMSYLAGGSGGSWVTDRVILSIDTFARSPEFQHHSETDHQSVVAAIGDVDLLW